MLTFGNEARIERFTTNYTANGSEEWVSGEDTTPFYWFRLRADGTTLFFERSLEGLTWVLIDSVTIATEFTGGNPDKVGICANNRNNSATYITQLTRIELYSFEKGEP